MSLTSRWMKLFCEEWQKPGGEECEYWRIEKPDSLIVVPIYESQVLLPAPAYRPGVGRCTLDLPGGRIDDAEKRNITVAAKRILSRELSLDADKIARVSCIDEKGTIVNSSFNCQKLYLASAHLLCTNCIENDVRFHALENIDTLLQEIECLQCSYALLRFRQIYLR